MPNYYEILLLIVIHIQSIDFGKLSEIGRAIIALLVIPIVAGNLIRFILKEKEKMLGLHKFEVTLTTAHTFEVIAETEEQAIQRALHEVDRITFAPEWEVDNIEEYQ